MANLQDVKDDEIREQLVKARGELKANNPTEAVHTLSDAFLTMLKKKPDLLGATAPGRRGRTASLAARWPSQGAVISRESLREGEPKIVFTKEKFAMSEALLYYEFTVENAVRQGI